MKNLLFTAALILASLTAGAQQTKCVAITQQKVQCSRNAADSTKFCRQHNPSPALHCNAPTKQNKPCKALVKTPGTKCKAHS